MEEYRIGGQAYDAFVIGLNCDRQLLYKRINERVDRMIDAGLYEEVLGLIESGVPCAAQAMKGIGYRETVDCILGRLPLESLPEAIKLSTRHFAKRQLTWYRREKDIVFVDKDKLLDTDSQMKFIMSILKEKNII